MLRMQSVDVQVKKKMMSVKGRDIWVFLGNAVQAYEVDWSTLFSCFSSLFSTSEACFFPRQEPR
jgi:hypothetical protein